MHRFQQSIQLQLVILIMVFISTVSYGQKYTLVIEPTYPNEQAKQIYEPLRKWLSKKTGLDLELVIDNNYYFYWRNAKGSRMPDFTFDAPHIAALRYQKKDYKLLATTIEQLSYHLVSLDEPKKGQTVLDFLISKRVMMLPSPSLASVFFKQWFTDLFAKPIKDVTALSWLEAVEIVFDGSASAAIVPNWMYNLYPNFASLMESPKMPGSTFMASPELPKDVVSKFQEAILSLIDDKEAYDVLAELNTEGFKKAQINDYEGLISFLPGEK